MILKTSTELLTEQKLFVSSEEVSLAAFASRYRLPIRRVPMPLILKKSVDVLTLIFQVHISRANR